MLIRSALALFLAASTALASPPTDEQVAAMLKTYNANRTKMTELQTRQRELLAEQRKEETDQRKAELKELADQIRGLTENNRAALAEVSLEEATLEQIEKIVAARVLMPEVNKAIAKPLAEYAKAPTVDGARAAELRVTTYPPASMVGAKNADEMKQRRLEHEKELVPVYAAALKHPALPELLKSGKGDGLVRQLSSFSPEAVQEGKLVSLVEPLITDDLPIAIVNAFSGTIGAIRDGAGSAERELVLEKIARSAESAAKKAPVDTPAAVIKRANDTAKLARSGWARGTMIGNAAPEIAFHWSSDPKFTTLSDLKGKVVLVDFWATWCGPCVASFPKIRELQARYSGYDVVILGVTSIQGYHYDRSNGGSRRIDCKDDPAKELGLMPSFMKDMDMTWPVVFSEDGCFNPNYGVRGIPHLALIDPAGKVRFNELRPGDPADDAERIDTLLKEFKLKYPAEPMAKAVKPAPAGS
jgi:thiol-disulfide isomerase/thioredoxin